MHAVTQLLSDRFLAKFARIVAQAACNAPSRYTYKLEGAQLRRCYNRRLNNGLPREVTDFYTKFDDWQTNDGSNDRCRRQNFPTPSLAQSVPVNFQNAVYNSNNWPFGTVDGLFIESIYRVGLLNGRDRFAPAIKGADLEIGDFSRFTNFIWPVKLWRVIGINRYHADDQVVDCEL